MRVYMTTIEAKDVGRDFLRRAYLNETGHFIDKNIPLRDAIGRVQGGDVGKRVYRVRGVIQVENNEQRDARLREVPRG